MTLFNSAVALEGRKPGDDEGFKVNQNALDFVPSNDVLWTHVADVDPIIYGGEDLSATHIDIHGDYAFVSHHVRGDVHKGALDVIDLTDAANPTIVSTIYLPNSDINSILVDENSTATNHKVWLALSDSKKGGLLVKLDYANGSYAGGLQYINLSNLINSGGVTASANALEQAGGKLYVTSGKSHGGVFCFNDSDLSYVGHSEFTDAKFVAASGDAVGSSTVATLQTGTNGALRLDDLGNYGFGTTIPLGELDHQNVGQNLRGKNTMRFDPNNPDMLYLAAGDNGMQVIDVAAQQVTYSTPAGMLAEGGNTNGIAFHGSYIYLANGADGLAVFNRPTGSEAPQPVFVWDLQESEASANYVLAEGQWIFVAKGKGGFKILKQPQAGERVLLATFDSQGVPTNLAPDVPVCSSLLPAIFSHALPESQSAIDSFPQYFNNAATEIHLTAATDLSLTFIHEGAGFKNVLGYYTYPTNTPPTSASELINYVIFPNTSAVNSGGGLIPGNTMHLLGNFDAGTTVGFFLLQDGYLASGNKLKDSPNTHYGIPSFNIAGAQQSVILHEQTCNSIIVAFEDKPVADSDEDFNDAIFQINASDPSAIDMTGIVQF